MWRKGQEEKAVLKPSLLTIAWPPVVIMSHLCSFLRSGFVTGARAGGGGWGMCGEAGRRPVMLTQGRSGELTTHGIGVTELTVTR